MAGRTTTPNKADAAYLGRVALFYLERYASSAGNLRRYLMQKVRRSATTHGTDPVEGADQVERLIAKLVARKLLNDAAFADVKARSYQRQGRALSAVGLKLRAKGVTAADTEGALERLREENPEGDLRAALAFARRRKFGPFGPAADDAVRAKQLAAMARRGFSLKLARAVLEAATPDEAEALTAD
jgi:regulatory protein